MKKMLPLAMLCMTCLFLCVGCAEYGGKWVEVRLETVPAEKRGRAYLVPLEAWHALPEVQKVVPPFKPADLQAFREKIAMYSVTSSKTPVNAKAQPYRTKYVVEYDGAFWWADIKPVAGKETTFSIEID